MNVKPHHPLMVNRACKEAVKWHQQKLEETNLRDQFAGQALIGITSQNEHNYGTSEGGQLNMAETAYELADQMLKVRMGH